MNRQHNNWTEHTILYEEFDDIEGVTTVCQSKKDKQHNGQKKKDKQHNGQKKNDKQHNGQKKNDK